MFKTIKIIVMATLCLNFSSKAQDNKAIDITLKGLQIGQEAPDVTITNLHNYKDANGKPATTAKLSDFKGKLLILDFWATWCSPCVAMIPKMDSLQKQFGDKIQFLSVTYQTEKEVLPFLEKYEKQKGKHYDLPVVAGDKELHRLFPHTYLPHYVWIDQHGVLGGITESLAVNRLNISMFLNGSRNFSRKQDFLITYNKNEPLLFSLQNLRGTELKHQSCLSGYIEGITSGFVQNVNDQTNLSPYQRITLRNCSVTQLFQVAFMDKGYYEGNRLILEVKEVDKINTDASGEECRQWQRAGNAYCYELITPKIIADSAWKIMRSELGVLFPEYTVKVEKREITCLVLKRTSLIDKIESKGGVQDLKFDVNGGLIKNYSIPYLLREIYNMGLRASGISIIDESNYPKNIDIELKADMRNIKSLNLGLAKYDLRLEEVKRKVDMLVIADRD